MFRVKIALISVLISGAVLISFGFFFMTVISKIGMDRIDREILALGESQLHVWHPKRHWQDFDQSLRSIYGQKGWKNLIVQVTNAGHQPLYRSPHWPPEITAASFPEFNTRMAPNFRAEHVGSERQAHPMDENRHNMPPRARHGQIVHPPPPVDGDFGRRHPPPPPRTPQGPVQIKRPFFMTFETASGTWRAGIMGNQHFTILLGMDLAGFHEDSARFKQTFLFSVPLALLLLAVGGWLIAHRALRPVTLITRTAKKITAQGLNQRIPVTGADTELLQLVTVINNMLDRLEKSYQQAVRFSADAAHELQTPLTILQGVLDDAVRSCPNGSDEQGRYSNLLEEVQRLKVIVQKLLILSKADAGQLPVSLEKLDLSAMVESILEDTAIVAPHLRIDQQIAPGCIIQADPELLRQVVQNLATNAVKYNHNQGLIRFRLMDGRDGIRFTIANTGTPISGEEQEQIFDRFYRIDKSRSHRVPGSGLGLSLAREIVRAHKGQLRFEPTTDGLNTFSLSLPRSSEATHP